MPPPQKRGKTYYAPTTKKVHIDLIIEGLQNIISACEQAMVIENATAPWELRKQNGDLFVVESDEMKILCESVLQMINTMGLWK